MSGTDHGLVVRRVLAFAIDALVVVAAARTVATRFARSGWRRPLATAVLAGTVGLPYHVLLEGSYGRTVGKAAAGIVLVTEDGDPCTHRAAITRTAFRLVDWLPVGYLLGLTSVALTERDQRLGDLAAGTVVVRAEGREASGRSGQSGLWWESAR